MDALPDVVLVIDRLGKVRYANRAAERQLGYRPADHVGRSLLELIHPDDVANVVSSIETVQAKAVGTPIDVRVRASDGSWIWFEEIGTNVTLDDGTPAILCTARNITQRRMWEVAAGDVQRVQQVLHVAPTIFLLLDGEGVVTSVNAAFTRMLGHDQSKVIGRPLTDFVAEGYEAEARASIADLKEGRTRVSFETRMTVVGQSAEARPVRFDLVNHLTDPVIGGIVASGYDVTELEAAREELEYLARHDPLTGLATRVDLARHVERLLRSHRPFAVLFVDLDRFKPVNDRWGHETGDRVLRLVASRLTRNVASGDLVARVGGDEFVVVVGHIQDAEGARRVAARLEAVICAPYELPAGRIRIGASVGVAVSEDRSTYASILADADLAMYAAKARRQQAVPGHRRATIRRPSARA